MEIVIVTIIVGLAVVYIGRKFYRNFKPTEAKGCDGGCCACAGSTGCTDLSLNGDDTGADPHTH